MKIALGITTMLIALAMIGSDSVVITAVATVALFLVPMLAVWHFFRGGDITDAS